MALVKYNNNSLSAITDIASSMKGAMTLIKEQTASSSATISFVDGTSDVVLDSTYPIYLFKFINIHPGTDGVDFMFNMSIDSGSNYNVAKTSSFFRAAHTENDTEGATLDYRTGEDLAQGTGKQTLCRDVGYDNDQSASGSLHLFNPSSTTFVKHFIAKTQYYLNDWGSVTDGSMNTFVGGYGNTTSAVDAIQFSMQSGNIDAGTIKLYGIKDS
mgnify:CR=1 FL=1